MTRLRDAAIVAGTLWLTASVLAQAPPTFRAGVEAVAVDAFVTDRAGNPVSGLSRDEFEITEDGKPQAITSFSLVDIPIERPEPIRLGSPEPDVVTNQGPEGRMFAIAVDEIRPEDALRSRAFLRRFLDEHFGPNDVGILVNIGRGRAIDTQDFTSNRRLLLAAVNRIQGWPRDGAFPASIAARAQANALRALVESLARIEGRRKALVLLINGLGTDVYDVLDYRGGVRSLDFDDLRAALTSAMRGGVAIYAIDPAMLTVGGTLGESDVFVEPVGGAAELERAARLRTLSEATGGFALVNSNSIDQAFARMVLENSTYYVLGYTSTNTKPDGRYRRLQVRVTRPGLTVRTRDGYIAQSKHPQGVIEQKERAGVTMSPAVAAAIVNPVVNPSVPMAVFATAYRTPSKEADVIVAVEVSAAHLELENEGRPEGRPLPERESSIQGEAEVVVVAISAAGRVSASKRNRFRLQLTPEEWDRARTLGVRVVIGMRLPPGRYQLRVAAGGTTAAHAGHVLYDLEVPDFGRPSLAMSALSVTSRQLQGAVMVPSTATRVAPPPPSATREFAAGDILSVYSEVYDNRTKNPHRLDVVTELRDADGHPVGRPLTDSRSDGKPVQAIEAMLPLDVPAGSYTLHMEARSTLEKQPMASRDVPIRVR